MRNNLLEWVKKTLIFMPISMLAGVVLGAILALWLDQPIFPIIKLTVTIFIFLTLFQSAILGWLTRFGEK